jgi:hypothetical protein
LKTKEMVGFVRSNLLVDRGVVGVAATGFDLGPGISCQFEGSMEAGASDRGVVIRKGIVFILGVTPCATDRR